MEVVFKAQIIEKLKDHFDFFPEINGMHFSGKRLSIDYVIVPKNNVDWKIKNIAFVLEYKDVQRIDGDTTNFTSWLALCVNCTNTKWDNYGYIYILTCPGIWSTQFMQAVECNWMLARVMGHLGIGELKTCKTMGGRLHSETHIGFGARTKELNQASAGILKENLVADK